MYTITLHRDEHMTELSARGMPVVRKHTVYTTVLHDATYEDARRKVYALKDAWYVHSGVRVYGKLAYNGVVSHIIY